MSIDPRAGSQLLEQLADVIDSTDGKQDWRQRLTRLAATAYAAHAAFLVERDVASRRLSVLASHPPAPAPSCIPFDSRCLEAWPAGPPFLLLSAPDAPELASLTREAITAYRVMPLSREAQSDILLLQAYRQPPPALTDEQCQGLRILAAHARLQLGDAPPVPVLSRPPSQQVLTLVETLFDRAPILIDGFDQRGRCILWNKECERVFGWRAEEIKAHPDPLALFYPEADDYRDVVHELASSGGSVFREWKPRTRDGRQLVALWANVALPNGDMICIGQDITDQKQAENQRRLATSVFESSYDGIMVMDASIQIWDVNPAFTRITGYSREDVIGQDPAFLTSRRHSRDFRAAIWRSLDESDSWKGELWGRHKSGEAYPLLFSLSVVRDGEGQVLHYVGTFSDITHLKRHEEELRHLARHDALTKAPNRLHFSERLEGALRLARDEQGLLAVCYLDLDGFKPINDRFGHAAGDQLLIVVSERLRHVIRDSDQLARLGGDEFAILLAGLHDTDECFGIIERMLHAINHPIAIGDALVRVSGSLGVTLFPHDDADAEILLRHADQAMYQAKRSGKNRYQLFDPETPQLERQSQQAIASIEQAFLKGEFLLHYQPEVDLLTGKVIGFEALLRWQHPTHGLLRPAEILPMILGTRLELVMGEWVIEHVLRQVSDWQQRGESIKVGINISANHLALPDFADRLQALMKRFSSVSGALLELEFQESVAIEDIMAISRSLLRCRELGLSIALDDFGTGYSSLSHLRELPIDTIKIDKSFVSGLHDETHDASLVRSIIQIAHRLGLNVIAEGVETNTHCQTLLAMNCSLVQGYRIAKPMPGNRVLPWLQKYPAR